MNWILDKIKPVCYSLQRTANTAGGSAIGYIVIEGKVEVELKNGERQSFDYDKCECPAGVENVNRKLVSFAQKDTVKKSGGFVIAGSLGRKYRFEFNRG